MWLGIRVSKKKRGWFSRAFRKVFSGQDVKKNYDERERRESTVAGVHVQASGYSMDQMSKKTGFFLTLQFGRFFSDPAPKPGYFGVLRVVKHSAFLLY